MLIGALFFLAQLVLVYYIYKTCKQEHKLAGVVRRLLVLSFFIVLVGLVAVFTTSERHCIMTYSTYFVVIDWTLYYLFRFSLEYIGNVFEEHVKKNAMILLLIADSVFVLLNDIFGHLFEIHEEPFFDSTYYRMELKPLAYIHYAIVLMLTIFCLITLYYRSFTAPAFYRNKYLLIALILTALAVVNLTTMETIIDLAIPGYVVETICIYYCVFVYTPQRLLPTTLTRVAEGMSVGLMVLDIDGKKVYNNKYAGELFEGEVPLVNSQGTTLEQWCYEQYKKYAEEFELECIFHRGEEEAVIKIQLQRMVDSHNQLQGCYFVIQDRTDEIRRLKHERYLATHDRLTGLYNKLTFYEKAEQYIKKHPEEELLMVCSDIKDFKMINDFFGMDIGDTILINFANSIR